MAAPADRDTSTVLQQLAAFVHEVSDEAPPPQVVAYAKRLILDTLGCAFGAMDSDVAHALRRYAEEAGGAPQATLIGSGVKTSVALATLVNGGLLRYLDCNDYYFGRDPAHPSGNLAVALAMAEREGRDGKTLIAALVAAYEVHLRLADHAGEPSLWQRGWHHGTNAQFSSAALAARLAGLDPLRTAHAMAIAGSHQNTLAQLQSGAISMIKATAEAWVAKAGVEAALLARHGMTGPLQLMEGPNGWARTVAGQVDIQALTAPLLGRYRLLETSIKPYPVVATASAPVRAAIDLHGQGLPAADAIARIEVRLPSFALRTPSAHPDRRYPAGIESAQHSFYFCAAVALRDGACGEAQFQAEVLSDPSLRALLAKIDLREDAELDALWPQAAGGGIVLHLHDGTTVSRICPYPPGHPQLALTDEELAAKFLGYAQPVLGHMRAHALRDAVLHLDECQDLRDFTPLLAPD
ncbi:MmgE/PrpD family protein [Bordetella sp. LUAb4]|uniref:MmgE/PrpD family protein n=1 Tax=Bordetella sp. LUAb4 TaxID=2843195 RepID=UPI001E3E1151|nr:MmgE/PrpD family protein [Bordetella sp. LUAb4]